LNPYWLLTGAVVLIGGAVVLALLRGASEEARLLAEELGRPRDTARAVRRLGDEVNATRKQLRGRRYPSL
jgi:hypothetical protein